MQEKKRILIIDDNGDIRDTLGDILESEGYLVQSSPSGEDALIQLALPQKPNLILLDLNMPGLDGFEFRQEQMADPTIKHIPVVVVSSDKQSDESCRFIKAKAHFRKPFDIGALLKVVQEFCL